MRTIHSLLIIMMLVAGCGSEQQPLTQSAPAIAAEPPAPKPVSAPEPVQDDRFTIVMLGDSLTAGFDLAARDALPEQLSALLKRNGFDVNIINAGVSGDTTAGGLARYDWSVASANPDMVVVALGANDFFNRVPAATARKNLAEIIARAKADGIEVILASVEAGGNPDEDPRIEEYSAIYPDLASEYDVPLFEDILKGVSGDFALVQLDGLHPTREGVKLMATRMGKFLGAYLPEPE